MKIFLAGATGVIGTRLIPLLLAAGYDIYGTTRDAAKAADLERRGVHAVVVDVFDAPALADRVATIRPAVVIHQLTDLPRTVEAGSWEAGLARNARVRDQGTRNLVAAAERGGVRRIIAQSILWTYAPGPEPHGENDPLDAAAAGSRGTTVAGVIALETAVMHAPEIAGIVLRYGRLYGPGTRTEAPPAEAPLHVDAAAFAALLAIDRGDPGVYNVAEENAYATTAKARAVLGWDSDARVTALADLPACTVRPCP